MAMYSTGETAKRLGVTRDSLFSALRSGAPDSAIRIGNRRIFTQAEVDVLAAWFERRRKIRDGLIRPWEDAAGGVSFPSGNGEKGGMRK